MKIYHQVNGYLAVNTYYLVNEDDNTETEQKGTFVYRINEDYQAVILKYKGNEANIEVPEKINGYPVTEITDEVFNESVETVKIPETITKIDDNAFYDCLNIETIVVGDATTEVGNDAFGLCKNLKNIVFLCNEKPTFDGDAFTDPISDQPYQVEKMYIPLSQYNNYVADQEFTTHTKEFSTNYNEDALFIDMFASHFI